MLENWARNPWEPNQTLNVSVSSTQWINSLLPGIIISNITHRELSYRYMNELCMLERTQHLYLFTGISCGQLILYYLGKQAAFQYTQHSPTKWSTSFPSSQT